MKLFLVDPQTFSLPFINWLTSRSIIVASRIIKGEATETSVIRELTTSDAVAIHPVGPLSANATFEIGIAVGKALPIFVLAGYSEFIASLREPVAQHFTSEAAFREAIETIDDSIAKKTSKITSRQRRGVLKLIEKVESTPPMSPLAFERFVLELLRTLSTESLSYGASKSAFDFAIWDSKLEPSIGSPLLIEAKITSLPPLASEITKKLDSLGPSYRNAPLLVIWFDGIRPRFERPNVREVQLLELAESLRTRTLYDTLRDIFGPTKVSSPR